MNKVKVVHIITKMELGGAQQNTLHTVSNLNPNKFQVYLITGPGGELYEKALSWGNTLVAQNLVREIRPLQDLKAFFQLCRILKAIKATHPVAAPVIVHTHSSKAGILGRWAARCSAIHIIVHSIHGFGFHDHQPGWIRKIFISVEKLTSRITTKFITVSKANKEQGCALHLFSPDNAVVIRSGIDIPHFQRPQISKGEVHAGLSLSPAVPVVAMIACLKPQKAPLDFIKVCDLVSKALPEAHYLLVGDGVLREAVEREIEKRHLQQRVHLLGWRQDIAHLLQAIDVLVLTSRWEGLPRVFPQAMAAGVPIVATRVDGAPEAIMDGVNGFLLPVGDLPGMAQKIIFLLENPFETRTMGQQGAKMVAEFDINKMMQQQEALYEELLAARGYPAPNKA
jgi:glycosyltransferase involved in cell wall biosynthesis